MPTTNFYFGRLNFKHQLTSLDDFDEDLDRADRVRRALFDYFNSGGVVYQEQDGDIKWVFGVCIEEDGYILGKFGKVYPDQPTTYDFEQGEFIEEEKMTTQADYSMFLIVPDKNLIIFNQRQHIGYRQFQNAFAQGYGNHVGLDDSLSIGLLQDAADVRQLIEESDIKYADFDLIPTNPTSNPDMQVLDDHIQNMEAEQFEMAAKSDASINMEDDLMQAALNMSAAGYGNFEIGYERDERTEVYKSEDRPASQEIDRPSTLEDLLGKASELIDRAGSLLENDDANG